MLSDFDSDRFPDAWQEDATLRAKPFWTELVNGLVFGDRDGEVALDGGKVTLCSTLDSDKLAAAANALLPWRKGPWQLGPLELDCEWRSDWKWDRIAPHLNLSGKRVADVGCGNGYYMFRALEQQPAEVVGLEPMLRFRLQFEWLHSFCNDTRMRMLPLGIEDLPLLPERFEILICMGVLYHRPDQQLALQRLHDALTPGGQLVLEGITLPSGTQPDVLIPGERYACMRNVFAIPTPERLQAWCTEVGFRDVQIVSDTLTTPEEQRGTAWMPYYSLTDFLDPENPGQTVEGYPAPRRSVLIATR